jgi:hypothetical protein
MAKRQSSILDFCNAKRYVKKPSETEQSISESEIVVDDVDTYCLADTGEHESDYDDHSYCRPQCSNLDVVMQNTQYTYKGVVLTNATEQAQSFRTLKTSYIGNVIEALRNRFANDSISVLKCFSLIEPRTDCSDENTAHYIDIIAGKYEVIFQKDVLTLEMGSVRDLKKGCYKGLSMQAFARAILTRHNEELPQTAKLCEIALCIPVSTAVCERGFSLQNWLKNKFRSCLGEVSLQNLMKICRGPSMTSFPFDVAVRHWYAVKKRRHGRLFKQSKTAVTE